MKLEKKHIVGLGVVGFCLCVAVFGLYAFAKNKEEKTTRKCAACSRYSCAVSECALVSELGDGAGIESELGKKNDMALSEKPVAIKAAVQLVHTHKEMNKEQYTHVANGCKKTLKNGKKCSSKKRTAKSAKNNSSKRTVTA